MTDYTSWAGVQLQGMFNNLNTSDEERKDLLKELQRRSVEHDPSKTCQFSEEKEVVFFAEWHEALIPGHIYSREGMAEYNISKTCEFHFDKWTKDDEDYRDPVWGNE